MITASRRAARHARLCVEHCREQSDFIAFSAFLQDLVDALAHDSLRRPSITNWCTHDKEPGLRLASALRGPFKPGNRPHSQRRRVENGFRAWIRTFHSGAAAASKRASRSGNLSVAWRAVDCRFHRWRWAAHRGYYMVPLQLRRALFHPRQAANGTGVGHAPVCGSRRKNLAPARPCNDAQARRHRPAARRWEGIASASTLDGNGSASSCSPTNESGRPGRKVGVVVQPNVHGRARR
jgi:hypothetical protein